MVKKVKIFGGDYILLQNSSEISCCLSCEIIFNDPHSSQHPSFSQHVGHAYFGIYVQADTDSFQHFGHT